MQYRSVTGAALAPSGLLGSKRQTGLRVVETTFKILGYERNLEAC